MGANEKSLKAEWEECREELVEKDSKALEKFLEYVFRAGATQTPWEQHREKLMQQKTEHFEMEVAVAFFAGVNAAAHVLAMRTYDLRRKFAEQVRQAHLERPERSDLDLGRLTGTKAAIVAFLKQVEEVADEGSQCFLEVCPIKGKRM